MKAAILVEQRSALVVVDVRSPEELEVGQVRVRVHYSGICGAQLNEIHGTKGPDRFLPHLLGHEGSGVVEEIGPGVTTVDTGDHVVLHWRPSDGIQSRTPSYEWEGRPVNAGWVTTFNEQAVVSENRVTRIPGDFDLKVAPLFGCSVTTAMGVIQKDARLGLGHSLVVFGVGGVGLNIVQCGALASAHPIVAVDIHAAKLEMAEAYGASGCVLSASGIDVAAKILELVGGRGADVVVDTTGNARVIESAYELTHPEGRTILVGVPDVRDKVSIYTLPLHFKKVLTGSHGGDAEPHRDIPRFIRLMDAGRASLDGMVTHEFGLDEINAALETMRRGEAGRVVIDMT